MVSSKKAPTKIRLFGAFEVEGEDSILHANEWRRKKAADLLKRLSLEKRLLKDQAIEFLWPDTDLDSGTNNLYKTIHVLRQTLNSAFGQGSAERIFQFEDGVLAISPDVWVDAHEFEELCRAYPSHPPDQRAALIKQALSLYRGDLLPDDIYADWTLSHRQELYRLHREARLALAQYLFDQHKAAKIPDILKPLLKTDPADELVHREMMRAFALSGRRHDALRQYQACVEALAAELDAPPGPETTALYEQIINNKLVPPKPVTASSAVLSPPPPVDYDRSVMLAGRQKELNELAVIFAKARQGQGRTVFISGESGIGKTRLAMEALHTAAQNGMQTLIGAAYEQEGSLPFQPFIEAFDHFLAKIGRDQKENPIIHFKPHGSSDPQQEHWALFKDTANFILSLAEKEPLVFLVDDLHAADETSLQLFHYLARQTRSAPIVLIAAYRNDAPANAQVYPLISALYREGLSETVRLESLKQDAVCQMLENIMQGEISNELCRSIYDVTAGNPFFSYEIGMGLLKMEKVEKRGESWFLVPGEKLRVPENLSAFLYQKVSRLGNKVQAALTAAAVIGREFDFEVLAGVTELSGADILDALDAALEGHLIEETPGGYRFRHPLIRRTLYESLSRVRRANLHSRAAGSIEASSIARPNRLSKQLEALAHHYDLSDRRDRALLYLVQAGEKAAGVYAFEVAIDYFERALALMDELGQSDPALRWRLLESLGWWHGGVLADTPRAVACFEEALQVETSDEHDWKPSSRDIVRAHCGAAVALITAGDIEGADDHLQKGLFIMGDREDAPEFADLLYNLAQLHWHRNEYQEAMDVAQRSLAIAERLNKPDSIARAFEMLALACHSLGEWQEGISYEQQRAELSGAGLDVTDAFDVHL
jgi:DNA-binding SARP family transcriptional activator/tetratricopeptide (TPR) repeat protein